MKKEEGISDHFIALKLMFYIVMSLPVPTIPLSFVFKLAVNYS